MKFLLKDLREIFNKHDLVNIYESGVNEDEYDPEIEELLALLLRKSNLNEISKNVDAIFERMFSKKFDKKKIKLLSQDLVSYLDSLAETMDILSDKKLMKSIRKSEEEIKNGNWKNWKTLEEVEAEIDKSTKK